jgi:hypothetical protein
MKPSLKPPRMPAALSDSLHHQLTMYALAASAAGVGMLATCQQAEAEVVYTPAHKWLPVNQFFYVDLNHDGVNDFKLILGSSPATSRGYFARWMSVWNAGGSQNEIYTSDGQRAAVLRAGKVVGPKSPGFQNRVHSASMFHSSVTSNSDRYFGPWLNIKQAYLGVRFSIKGKIHYGWARLQDVSSNGNKVTALLAGYAYESIPGKAIVTGVTSSTGTRTAEPTLGELARGRK